MRLLNGIIDSMDISLSQVWEIVKDREAWRPCGHKELDTTEQLNKEQPHNFQEVRNQNDRGKAKTEKASVSEQRTSGQRSSPHSACSY